MDTLGGLAFAGEAPMSYYMKEKPKRSDEKILSDKMLSHVILSGIFTLALCTIFLVLPAFRTHYRSESEFMTAFYALFIFAGIFNCLGARSERLWIFTGIAKNRAFIFIMILISALQILMMYYGGTLFRSVPLTIPELLLALATASAVIPFDVIRRVITKLK